MKSALVTICAGLLTATMAYGQVLTEAHVTQIMKVANEGEIDAGKLAKKRANNDQVKAFAKKMVDEHEKNEKEVKQVAKKADIGMDNNDAAKQLKEHVKTTIKDLKDKKDAEFDRAYIASQVDMHQSLLNQIENQLLAAAKTPALKEYLTKTRDHVKMHLDEAKSIQTALQ